MSLFAADFEDPKIGISGKGLTTPVTSLFPHFHFLPFSCQICSVVECLTCNHGVMGLGCTGSSGFFVGVSLDKTLQSISQVLVKPRKDMNNVNCRRDMTELLLKAA